MITDAQLDAQLNALKAIVPDESVKFKSVNRFKADFFKRVHALNTETKKEKKRNEYNDESLIDRLRTRLLGLRTRAGNRGPRARAGRSLDGMVAAAMPFFSSHSFMGRRAMVSE